jgi:hypothetical protein
MTERVTKKSVTQNSRARGETAQIPDRTRTRFRGRFWNLPENQAHGCTEAGSRQTGQQPMLS